MVRAVLQFLSWWNATSLQWLLHMEVRAVLFAGVCHLWWDTRLHLFTFFWSCLLSYTVKMVKKCGTVPLFIIRNLFVPCQLIFLGLTVNTAQSKQTKWCEARVWVFVLFCFLSSGNQLPGESFSLLEIITEQPKYQFFFRILSQRFF